MDRNQGNRFPEFIPLTNFYKITIFPVVNANFPNYKKADFLSFCCIIYAAGIGVQKDFFERTFKKLNLLPEKALQHVDTMYKVYMGDKKKNFKISRIVTLTKMQKDILSAVDKKLLNPAA